ncbi:MAG: phosphatase PAP2 family protein [Planctomycetota bacterium]
MSLRRRFEDYGCLVLLFVSMMFLLLVTGCSGTMENDRGWDPDVSFGDRLGQSAWNALADWQTVGPSIGAAIFGIGEFDERTSAWAVNRNPVFGSVDNAQDWSDYLNIALIAETAGTLALMPSGDDPETDTSEGSKIRDVAVEAGAWGAGAAATGILKNVVGRPRPGSNRDSKRSFPSGHASTAFSLSTLSNRNIDYMSSKGSNFGGHKKTIQWGNIGLATGVAWARVEGEKHYPSDVLAGAAIGHFLTAFVHDFFFGLSDERAFDFQITPTKDYTMAHVVFSF